MAEVRSTYIITDITVNGSVLNFKERNFISRFHGLFFNKTRKIYLNKKKSPL